MKIKTVISGSFRKHLNEIGVGLEAFRKAGIEVLAPVSKNTIEGRANFVFLSTDDPKKSAYVLEKEFMSNITKSDFLYVANVRGYIGKSVAAEIGLALIHSIPIVAAEEIKEFSDEIPVFAHALLKRAIFAYLPVNSINALSVSKLNLTNFVLIDLSPDHKIGLDWLINTLLEELKHVKI